LRAVKTVGNLRSGRRRRGEKEREWVSDEQEGQQRRVVAASEGEVVVALKAQSSGDRGRKMGKLLYSNGSASVRK